MNLHEYQGKQLFAEYGLPVSKGYAVDNPQEAAEAASKIGGDMWVGQGPGARRGQGQGRWRQAGQDQG
jgi:succinyl-CoA synthetase beta subunit